LKLPRLRASKDGIDWEADRLSKIKGRGNSGRSAIKERRTRPLKLYHGGKRVQRGRDGGTRKAIRADECFLVAIILNRKKRSEDSTPGGTKISRTVEKGKSCSFTKQGETEL